MRRLVGRIWSGPAPTVLTELAALVPSLVPGLGKAWARGYTSISSSAINAIARSGAGELAIAKCERAGARSLCTCTYEAALEIMASPGLAVPEEPHQPLSFKFPKRQCGLITLHKIAKANKYVSGDLT